MFILIITIPFGVAAPRIGCSACGRSAGRSCRPNAGADSAIGNVSGSYLRVVARARPPSTGSVLCITIIGIPFGFADFKLIPVSLHSVRREIVDLDQARRLGYAAQVRASRPVAASHLTRRRARPRARSAANVEQGPPVDATADRQGPRAEPPIRDLSKSRWPRRRRSRPHPGRPTRVVYVPAAPQGSDGGPRRVLPEHSGASRESPLREDATTDQPQQRPDGRLSNSERRRPPRAREAPRDGPFEDPEPQPGTVVVDVAAAGLHHLDLLKAGGSFYMGPPPLPSAVGTDGVGRLQDGRRVYFDETVAPFGSMAEHALGARDRAVRVRRRARRRHRRGARQHRDGRLARGLVAVGIEEGDTVLVLGCGAFGSLAVQIAKLPARAGSSRRTAAESGSSACSSTVPMPRWRWTRGRLAAAYRTAAEGDLDVTIDTLWGAPADGRDRGRGSVRQARAGGPHRRADDHPARPGAAFRLARPARVPRRLPPPDVRQQGFLDLTRHVAAGRHLGGRGGGPRSSRWETAWERQRRAQGGAKLVLVP